MLSIFLIYSTHTQTHTHAPAHSLYAHGFTRLHRFASLHKCLECAALCCNAAALLGSNLIGTSLCGSDCFHKLLPIQRSTPAPLAVARTILRKIRTQRTMTGTHISVKMNAGEAKF